MGLWFSSNVVVYECLITYYKGNGATNCKFSFYFSIWIEERRHFREILLKNKCKKKNIYNDDEFATSLLRKLRRNVDAIACFELRHEFVVIVNNTHFFGVATIATKWSWRKPILTIRRHCTMVPVTVTIRHRIITITWQHFHRKFVAIVNYDCKLSRTKKTKLWWNRRAVVVSFLPFSYNVERNLPAIFIK